MRAVSGTFSTGQVSRVDRAVPRWLPGAAFLFGAVFTALPIVAHLYLPLIDLPNHIARLHIAAAPADGPLAAYYSYSAALVPNSAADLAWRLLGFPGDAARFAQHLMAIYAVNLIAASMVLSRAVHGHWSVWPAAAALVVYSSPFFLGFQNFVFSLPFVLYGLALWLALETGPLNRWRLAVFVPLAATLYLMHFFAFAILAIAVFGRELQRGLERPGPLWRRALALGVQMVPFALPTLWLAATILMGPETPGPSRTEFGAPVLRLSAFVSPLAAPNAPVFASVNVMAILGMVLLAACLSRMFSTRGPRLELAPAMRGPAVALAVAAVIAPSWLNGVALVHIRVPVALVLVLLAGTCWRDLCARRGTLIALAFAALVAGRGIAFDRLAADYGADMSDLHAATETLPAEARVLPLRAPGYQFEARLSHMQGHLVRLHDVFVPTLFQGVHSLQVNDVWRDHAEPVSSAIDLRWIVGPPLRTTVRRAVFVDGWESKFTHALLMDPLDEDVLSGDPRLRRVAASGRFTLFEVIPSGAN